MIDVRCDMCGNDLNEPGGLAFSPPSYEQEVLKFHICTMCWLNKIIPMLMML